MQLIHSGCGCFCWALPLFFLLLVGAVFGLLSDETQIWLGDLRVVLWCRVFCLFVPFLCGLLPCTWPQCYVLSFCFYASTPVRTEPRATSAKPEEKNMCMLPLPMAQERQVAWKP